MRHQLHASRWAALLVAALATASLAQPAPSRTSPGRNAPTVSDVGPPPAEDRDSVGAIVLGTAPPRLASTGDAAKAAQTMGGPPAPAVVPRVTPTRDTDTLRRRGAGGLIEN